MVKQKYEESNMLIAQRKGLPKSIQQQIIISDKEKEAAKTCVLYVKENIKNNAILLANALPSDKGTDVRVAKRIFSFLDLLPLIKSESRFKLLYGPELLVIASIEGLAEVLYLTQDLTGIHLTRCSFSKPSLFHFINPKTGQTRKRIKKKSG